MEATTGSIWGRLRPDKPFQFALTNVLFAVSIVVLALPLTVAIVALPIIAILVVSGVAWFAYRSGLWPGLLVGALTVAGFLASSPTSCGADVACDGYFMTAWYASPISWVIQAIVVIAILAGFLRSAGMKVAMESKPDA